MACAMPFDTKYSPKCREKEESTNQIASNRARQLVRQYERRAHHRKFLARISQRLGQPQIPQDAGDQGCMMFGRRMTW